MLAVADRIPLCLDEPKPLVIFNAFADSSVALQLSCWAKRENFLELRNTVFVEVKKALDEAGIEIPFPHLSLYAGEASKPIPFRTFTASDSDAGKNRRS